MAILQKLKSLLGFDDAETERRRDREVEFDVEREQTAGATGESGATDTTIEPETDDASETVGAPASGSVSDDSSDDDGVSAAEPALDDSVDASDADTGGADGSAGDATGATTETDDESLEAADGDETDDEADVADETDTIDEIDAIDEAEPASGAGSSAEADAEPVDSIKGIGPAYAERLAAAGVETVDDLAAADADDLENETDISATRIQGWIDRAEVR